ncbi:protein disulfide-isomerase TMX3-like [Acipenser oxyrinchus oxyrinchus]|uniref:Protein disulfide-isomerase TMX3 n=1 Tax=Acipenser oxyrinchus oxyrinchus TaxID=40147 RepID=A0AAD8GD50_ACIOX|nr:protein disulfide-isomerase TMX3-like [Acipenser oxyrinchus oxyrinchus]
MLGKLGLVVRFLPGASSLVKMAVKLSLFYAAVCTAVVSAFVEELDDSFKDTRMGDTWIVDFYAPWCGHCKKLEPVWHEVGAEMRSSGSPVRVGKIDATAYSSVASELGVRGYPTIKLLKGDLAYNYRGPRTKDDIIEFANRVAGPVVRSLPSQQMFEHVQKRHDVLFLYVGGESPLKEKYIEVASELIVYTYFFSALEEVLPKHVTLQELPAVLVFKDGTYFVYDEYEDGDLSSWINKERFQGYLHIDGFTLYELEDTGKLVGIAVIDDKNPSEESIRLKSLIQTVAKDYREHFNRDFQFGHMDGNDYINSLIMDEVTMPTIIVLNTSNQQYFLPSQPIEHIEDLVRFINEVLDGTAEAQGGDGILQRIKRVIYDVKSTVVSVFKSSPLLGCFLFGLPLGVISIMCYGICTADSDDGSEEAELFKIEGRDQELTDEGSEDELEDGNDEQQPESGAEHSDEEHEEKTSTEKKID